MITQIVPSEVCLRCKGCCRFNSCNGPWIPSLRNEEVATLLEGSIPPAFISTDKKLRVIHDTTAGNAYLCPCLNVNDDRCVIYEHRPFECQLYPLVLVRNDDELSLAADPQCPFVEQNMLEPAFQEYVEVITAFLKSTRGRLLIERNPHLFQEYPGAVIIAQIDAHAASKPVDSPQESL